MAFGKVKNSKIRRNPVILNTTPKEPLSLYIPRSVISFLLFALVIGLLVYFFVLSDTFKIKKVIYVGNISEAARVEVEKVKGENILQINNFKLADVIKKAYPQAYTVSVYKGLPDVLKVVTTERSVALIWQSGGKSYLVDKMGVVFREIPDLSLDPDWIKLPQVSDVTNFKVILGDRLVSSRFIDFVSYINNNFTKITGIKAVKIEIVETSFHPILVTEFGWKVMLDGNRSGQFQLEDLKKILNQHKPDIKEYVDLRVEGYGYYK